MPIVSGYSGLLTEDEFEDIAVLTEAVNDQLNHLDIAHDEILDNNSELQ